jgi:hypothetical protein
MRVNAEEKLAAIVIADVADYEYPMTPSAVVPSTAAMYGLSWAGQVRSRVALKRSAGQSAILRLRSQALQAR